MNTEDIWSFVATVPIGTVVAIGIVIITILCTLLKLFKELFGLFQKLKSLQDGYHELEETVRQHQVYFEKNDACLALIRESLKEQREFNLKKLRNDLVHQCDLAAERKYVTPEMLESIHEMYDEYKEVFHGNSYVTSLVARTDQLQLKIFEDNKYT